MSEDLALRHQFAQPQQQRLAADMGIWVFLITEVMFFAALFTAYVVYRSTHPAAFVAAARHTYVSIGTINTAVLLTSSLTMALAVRASHFGQRSVVRWLLAATAALGSVFVILKGIEYYLDYCDGLVPKLHFLYPHGPMEMFYYLYFVMTGLHAIHLMIGIGVVIVMIFRTRVITTRYYSPIEVTGIYWHFIDIVWIFLYPLIYLPGRH